MTYDSFIIDGHSEYGQTVASPPAHEAVTIANTCNRDVFLEHLSQHSQGRTSYLEMSKGLADSGIEKWTFNTDKMTLTYYDQAGNEVLVEDIILAILVPCMTPATIE